MARMIPEVFDEATASAAERTLFYALQDGLDRGWTVIHALSWTDGRGRFLKQGECDLVVVHPERGLLAVEVKSGAPRYDNRRGVWVYDDGHTLKDPFAQARASSHHLGRILQERAPGWARAGLPFGYAVAFPDARDITGNLLPEMTPELMLLEPDLGRIQRRLEGLLERFWEATGTASTAAMQEALDVLQPEFGLVAGLGPGRDGVLRQQVRLTEEQMRALDFMGRNRRLLVRGGAGTGKTVLVCEQARRVARGSARGAASGAAGGAAGIGQDVLILCFNNSLEGHLQEVMAGNEAGGPGAQTGRIAVHTFHGLCRRIVEETGGGLPVPEDGARQGEFWNETLPAEALDRLEAWPVRFDAVLVDEAQDFLPGWWVPVEGLLRDGASSQLLVVGDERQDLYRRGFELPFTEPVCDLELNCRNTRQIARWVHAAAGLPEPADLERLPEGPEVEVIAVSDAAAEAEAVRKTLHRLIHDEGLSCERIAILGKHRITKSCFAERRKLGNVTLTAEGEDPVPGAVRYATIHKFKGLEADCVLLVGVGEPSGYFTPEDEKRFLYVGGSRARWGLVVFEREGVL